MERGQMPDNRFDIDQETRDSLDEGEQEIIDGSSEQEQNDAGETPEQVQSEAGDVTLVKSESTRIYYDFGARVSKPSKSQFFSLNFKQEILEIAHSFGMDSNRLHNVRVLDKDTLAFIAGSYVRVYSLSTKKTTLLRCTSNGSVACLAVHPLGLWFASGEAGQSPDINVFEFPSCKLQKVLSNGTQREYVSLTFDPVAGDLLASQGGEPDYSLTIWQWMKEVPLLRVKSFSQDVYNVSFSEELPGSLVTSGLSHIRFWRMAYTFTGLKLKGETGRFGARRFTNIEASIQFPDGKVLSGSEEGSLLLWEEGLLIAEFKRRRFDNCHAGAINQMFMHEREVLSLGEDGYIRMWNPENIVLVRPDYFGEIFVLTPLHEVYVCSEARLTYMVQSTPEISDDSPWYVADREGRVWQVDLSIINPAPPLIMLHYHGGPVTACAVSPKAHLVATVGKDGMLRIFDCLQKEELLAMTFSSPASSLIWVPRFVDEECSSVIIGFEDGTVRKVAFCAMSTPMPEDGGTTLLERKLSQVYKPHKNRVTSLSFSHDETIFASGSSDKTVFLFYVEKTMVLPAGWLYVPTGVIQLVWTPVHFSYMGLLVVCEEGNVLELQIDDLSEYDVTTNMRFTDAALKIFKFHSIKSKIRHAEQLAAKEEEKKKLLNQSFVLQKQNESKVPTDKSRDKEYTDQGTENGEDEEREPFIPDPPSPILQAVYSATENRFWLSLGGYDAGYLYMCQFPEECIWEEENDCKKYLMKPVESVAIPNCSDNPVTVLRIDKKIHIALLGFSNGRIRLVQLSPIKELFDLSAYWDINAHDIKHGSLTGMEFAYDHSLVVTTGMDGNILLFSYAGLLETMTKTCSALPTDMQHHATCYQDITSDALCFAKELENKELDSNIRQYEELKQEKRAILKGLLNQLKNVKTDNKRLPLHHRLSQQELLINANLETDHQTHLQEQLAELHKVYAWHSEHHRLMLEKVLTGFLKQEDLPWQFAVEAFNGSFQIKSCRKPATHFIFEQFLKETAEKIPIPTEQEEQLNTIENAEPSISTGEELWQAAYEMTRRRSVGLTGTAARSLKMALDKASRTRSKRAKRQSEWEQLYEEKTLVDKESPEEVAAIETAKNTFGDFKLKTDRSNVLDRAKHMTLSSACQTLAKLDFKARCKITEFNEQLIKMRDEKRIIVDVIHELKKHLCQVSHGTRTIATVPKLTMEDVPEMKLALDTQKLLEFSQNIMPTNESYIPELRLQTRVERKYSSSDHRFYKDSRSEYPHIVNSVLRTHTEEEDIHTDTDLIFTGQAPDSETISALRRDINAFSGSQIAFEEEIVHRCINSLTAEFDGELHNFKRERSALDVVLKMIDLKYVSKLQEYLLYKSTEEENKILLHEQAVKKEHISKINNALTNVRKQAGKKMEEIEERDKMLSQLWLEFQEACVDYKGSRMMKFLICLYKRKTREATGEDSGSDKSSSQSSLSIFSSGSTPSMSLDLEYCPLDLNKNVYDKVVVLQSYRQALDEVQTKSKQDLASLQKEIDHKCREVDSVKLACKYIEERFMEFCKNRIRKINDIDSTVLLNKSNINSTLSEGIVVNLDLLERLSCRIHELETEVCALSEIKKRDRKQSLSLRQNVISLKKTHKALATRCQEEMCKKFGKPVDLRMLELVTLNPKIQILQCSLLMDRDSQLIEQKKLDQQLEQLKVARKDQLERSTAKICAMTDMVKGLVRLEKQLDGFTTVKFEDLDEKTAEKLDDQVALSTLTKYQAAVIQECLNEIYNLHSERRDGKNNTLPPVFQRHRRFVADGAKLKARRGVKQVTF